MKPLFVKCLNPCQDVILEAVKHSSRSFNGIWYAFAIYQHSTGMRLYVSAMRCMAA